MFKEECIVYLLIIDYEIGTSLLPCY